MRVTCARVHACTRGKKKVRLGKGVGASTWGRGPGEGKERGSKHVRSEEARKRVHAHVHALCNWKVCAPQVGAGGHVDQELTSLMDSLTLKTLSLVSGKCSASSKAQSTCASGTTSPAGPARRASGEASVRGAEIHTVQLQCSCTVREIASMNGVKLSCGARAQGPRHRTITGARFAGEANRVRGQASKRGGLT